MSKKAPKVCYFWLYFLVQSLTSKGLAKYLGKVAVNRGLPDLVRDKFVSLTEQTCRLMNGKVVRYSMHENF